MSATEHKINLQKISLDNFKSLVQFEIELEKFTCLIGLNGSGKTAFLQAVDFLAQLMIGDLTQWLKQRDWKSTDLNCKLLKRRNIEFSVELILDNSKKVVWRGEFNTRKLNCSSEIITLNSKNELKVIDGKYTLTGQANNSPINFTYQGSILSQLKDSILPPSLLAIKQAVQSIKSLELLSPHLMRQRARQADDVGVGGEKPFLLFDEIENGVNPELVEKLINMLLIAPQQILVTTHSPMILNYLPDDVARKSVILVYKTPAGYSRATRFFDIPSVAQKLGLLGPGEVFIDTDLDALTQELNAQDQPA